MEALNPYYLQLLESGLVQVRHALWARDYDWAQAQVELLHNIPSLIGEMNIERHRYFWEGERPHYLEWLGRLGSAEARAKTATYYEPVWSEMEPTMTELLRPAVVARES